MTSIVEEVYPLTWVEFISDNEAVHNLYNYYCDGYDSDDEHVRPRGADIAPEKSMILQYIGGFRKNSMVDIDDAVEMYISTYFFRHEAKQLNEIIDATRTIRSMVMAHRARCQILHSLQPNSDEDKWQIRTMKVCECVARSLSSLVEIAEQDEEEAEDDRDEEMLEAYISDSVKGDWVRTSDDGNWMNVKTDEIWDEMEHCGMLPWEQRGDTDDEDEGEGRQPTITVSKWRGPRPKNLALPAEDLHTGTPSNSKVKPDWVVPPSLETEEQGRQRKLRDNATARKELWYVAPTPPPT